MFERWAIPALSTVLSFTLWLATPVSLAFLLLRTAIPCQPESALFVFAQFALLPACLTGAIWLSKMMFRPRLRSFIIAVAIPGSAIGLFAVSRHWDAVSQQSCRQQVNR